MIKKILVGLFVALCLFAVGYNAYQSEKQATTGKHKVYAMLPLSGLYTQFGKDIKSVIEWYMANKNPPFEIVYVDSQGEPAKALTAFQQKAIYAKKPIVLSAFAPVGSVLVPSVKEKKGFLFSISTVGISSDLNNFQIVSRSSKDITDLLAPYIQKNFKSIAIFYSDDEYGLREMKAMEKSFSGKIHKEVFIPRNPDVRIEVLKALDTKPEAVVVLGSPTTAYVNIFKELKNHQYQGAVLSNSNFTNPNVLPLIGNAAENVISAAMFIETEGPHSAQVKALKTSFGKKLYYIMAEAFEALEIINYTLSHNLPFSQETYQKLGTWKGISGDIQFLENGKSSIKSYVLIHINDGKIIPFEEKNR